MPRWIVTALFGAVALTVVIVVITALQYLGVLLFVLRGIGRLIVRIRSGIWQSACEGHGLPVGASPSPNSADRQAASHVRAKPMPSGPDQFSFVWLLFALIPIAALLSGPYGFPRYQTMIVPLMSIFAAAGWQRSASASSAMRHTGPKPR